jgi:hypothetical protein
MKIHTLWKEWDDGSVELLFALDEATFEVNWQAWEEGCAAGRAKYGIQPEDTREVVIDVPYAAVHAAFVAPVVAGKVVEP